MRHLMWMVLLVACGPKLEPETTTESGDSAATTTTEPLSYCQEIGLPERPFDTEAQPLVGGGLWHGGDQPERRDLSLGARLGGGPTIWLYANGAWLPRRVRRHHRHPASAVLPPATDQHLPVPRRSNWPKSTPHRLSVLSALSQCRSCFQTVFGGSGHPRNAAARGIRCMGLASLRPAHCRHPFAHLGLHAERGHRHSGLDGHAANSMHAPCRRHCSSFAAG